MSAPMPVHETVGFKILLAYEAYGSMTMEQLMDVSDELKLPISRIKSEFTRLLNGRKLARISDRYYITAQGSRFLLMNKPKEKEPEIVPFPTPMPFRPLSAKYIPSVRGRREGSDDYLAIPSKYGDKS